MKRIHPFKIEAVKRGINQLDLADAAHMHPGRLTRILNGRAEPQDYELKNLRRGLGLQREGAVA